jgi:hypothetical protein
MAKYISLIIILLLNTGFLKAQTDKIYKKTMSNIVVEDTPNYYHQYPSDMLEIKSADSTVYAVESAEVLSVTTIEDIKVVITKNDSIFYVYSNLKSTDAKKGDKVSGGAVIGYAALDESSKYYRLDFLITTERKESVLREKNNCRGGAKTDY